MATKDRITVDGVVYTRHSPIDCTEKGFEANYPGFKQERKTLAKGTVCKKGYGKLPCDIIYERDVEVVLRDGVKIYTDIFRPQTSEPVPAIVAWGPYGKNGSGNQTINAFPGKLGIHTEELSGLFMFEAPDPGYWVDHGYAVCNVDIRGTMMSEGNTPYWGAQDGEDGYDFIEWAAAQPWCNGKVGMSGNSWLAVSQWHIAAQQPPHLACIAPWEGSALPYQDDIVRGGIDSSAFCRMIIKGLFGNGYVENPPEMAKEHPLLDDYWASKVPDFSKIAVPAYVVASWSSQVHTDGTLHAWRKLPGADKWLRVHNNLEWTDFYSRASMDDLRRFFDRYLKGESNGWEQTPKIRLSILDPGHKKEEADRVEEEFPLARTGYTKLHLCDGGKLSLTPQTDGGSARYRADLQGDSAVFEYTFADDVELLGYSKLRVWIEAESHDNADIFVYVQKVLLNGKVALHHPITPDRLPWSFVYPHIDMEPNKYRGPLGRLRCSLRHIDAEKSTEAEPHLTYDRREPLEPGVPVCVEVPLWPTGMKYHAGETLRLVVSGNDIIKPVFDTMDPVKGENNGNHILRYGGEYDSYLQIPVTPK